MKKQMQWILTMLVAGLLILTGCGNNERPVNSPTAGATQTPVPTAGETQTPVPTEEPAEEPTPTEIPEEVAAFDRFMDELFVNDIAANTINLHYTLAYPENYGITDYEITLGDASYEALVGSYDAMRGLKSELEKFVYDELTNEQQFTYDILMDYLDTELGAEDLLLYSEFFGPTTGYQAQLPVLLAEYTFRREQDIEDYLGLLCVVDDMFCGMLEFEQKKSEAGLFMSDATLESILDQCRQFIENREVNYMIEVFDSKVAEADWLTDVQREEYSKRNKELITTELVGAYRLLMDGLSAFKGTGTNELGLCYYEKGKEQYEYLAYVATGSGRSVEELAVAIPEVIYEAILAMQDVMRRDSAITEKYYDLHFVLTDPEEILKDLTVKIAETFPELPEVTYQIKYVHPSMQEHMSPAFYLTPPVDDYMNNVIYINPLHQSDDIYVTMAHEGFPGHLYQSVYTASKDLPLVRNLFGYSGYTEGWAQYVEFMAYDMGIADGNLAAFVKNNAIATLGISAAIDVGVHYYGWTVDDVEIFMTSYGVGDRESAQWVFDYVVAEPSTYLSYFVGYMEFVELQELAEKTWGDKYSDTGFYDAVLSLGPAPFPLLEKEIISMEP